MSKRRGRRSNKRLIKEIVGLIIAIYIVIAIYIGKNGENINILSSNNVDESNIIVSTNVVQEAKSQDEEKIFFDLSTIPEYTDSPYVEINNNVPYFTEEDYTEEPFENYSEWDILGRSGVAFANICKEIMPDEDEERGSIGSVSDLSGWVQKRYDDLIADKYLYNRCHLIGWQLAGENANKNNLITGTRYLNTDGMLPFENMIADYMKDNEDNHVLYRATPIFEGNNKLASGVELEAWSIEDKRRWHLL